MVETKELKYMKRLLMTSCLLAVCFMANAQLKFTWELVPMDSTWDEIKNPAATNILQSYSDLLGPLQEIIGYSPEEFSKYKPESELSNFAADAFRQVAIRNCNCDVDIAMTNFGGIRTNLPKGAVRVYDIYSIFPFDNVILLCDIKGSDLKKYFELCVQENHVEAFSNVKIVTDGKTVKECLVGGEKIDPNKMYKFATSNFMMEGGDMNRIGEFAQNIQNTGVLIREGLVDYIKSLTANGEKLDLKKDGRVTIIK